MTRRTIRLATVQSRPDVWREEADPFSGRFVLQAAQEHARALIDQRAAVVEESGKAGVDLVVAVEDLAGVYGAATYLDDRAVFRALVEDSAAHARAVLSDLARRYAMYIVGCFFELEGNHIYNTAVLFDRGGGIAGRYHKVHLPGAEMWQCKAGNSFPVFEADFGKIGMLVCYDQMWPESAAALALGGARIICHPSVAPVPDYQMRTRASDHQVFYISSTKRGSRIVRPNADVLADAGEANHVFVTAEVDLEAATLAPAGYWDAVYSGIRDHRERHLKMRRPDCYRILTEPRPPALDEYVPGGLAIGSEAVQRAYEQQKEALLMERRGERSGLTWQWLPDSPEMR